MSLRRRELPTTNGACVSRLATVLHAGQSWHGASPLPVSGRLGRARSPRKPSNYTFYLEGKPRSSDWKLWLRESGTVDMAKLRADVLQDIYLSHGVEPLSSSSSTQRGFRRLNASPTILISEEELLAQWIQKDRRLSVRMQKKMTSGDGTVKVFFFIADFEDVVKWWRGRCKRSG